MMYGWSPLAGGKLCYFNTIESIPSGPAVLVEELGVVPVGWLLGWSAVSDPGGTRAPGSDGTRPGSRCWQFQPAQPA